MGKIIDTKVDDGVLTFTFTNKQGEVFSSFDMNPMDINLAERCEETVEYFEKMKSEAPELISVQGASKYNRELEEKINFLLGYDASSTLFKSPLTATTVFPDGSIFAFLILDKILDAVMPEIERRKKKMSQNIKKYTEKYEK